MFEKHLKMEESVKVDEKSKRAFNLGYEVAIELNLKNSYVPKKKARILP